jgi:hypothetical protein
LTLDTFPAEQRARKPLSKKLRFEVLKRDCFKCRYCGKTAEEARLHVDHVMPVADGGADDIMNLVAACESCNLGKRDIPLDDKTYASSVRRQTEILQEQKETLKMMAEWRAGLRDLEGQKVTMLADHWSGMTPGYAISDSFKPEIRRWLKRYTFEQITEAMDTAARQYLEYDSDGKCTTESFDFALDKVAPILKWQRKFAEDPTLERLLYIRGIARKRCPRYFPDRQAMDLLKQARDAGVSIDDMMSAALSTRSYTSFENEIDGLICSLESARSGPQESRPQSSLTIERSGLASQDPAISELNAEDSVEDWLDEKWSTDLGDHHFGDFLITAARLIDGRSVAEIKADRVWLCGVCGAPIRDPQSANVVRYAGPDQLFRLKIQHREKTPTCLPRNEGLEFVGPLSKLTDSNAVNEFASMLQGGEYLPRALSEMMKRCLVPGYELAHYHFAFALQKGVVESYNSDGCLWDWQIDRILVWLGGKGPFLPPWEGSPESRVPIPSTESNEHREDTSGDPEL